MSTNGIPSRALCRYRLSKLIRMHYTGTWLTASLKTTYPLGSDDLHII